MATRKTQHGASAKGRRSATGASNSSRARSTARSTPRTPAKSGSRTPAKSARRTTATARASRRNYIVPLAIVAVLVIAAWSFYPVARLQYSEERQAAQLEVELDGLKERNADLRAQVDRLKTPEGVEEVARESLGLVKEGENLVVVVDGDEEERPVVTNPDTATIPEAETSSWANVLDALFGFE